MSPTHDQLLTITYLDSFGCTLRLVSLKVGDYGGCAPINVLGVLPGCQGLLLCCDFIPWIIICGLYCIFPLFSITFWLLENIYVLPLVWWYDMIFLFSVVFNCISRDVYQTWVTVAVVYSISQEICTRVCFALLCCGYAIVSNEFTWNIYPYSSGLLCWHWGNR